MNEPQVDETFRAWLPEQLPEVVEGLRESIRAEGVRDPLVVWEETGLLVDGHTRLAIANDLGVPYETIKKSFASRDDALDWMIKNQLEQRNPTDVEKRELIGRRYLAKVRERQATRGPKGSTCDQQVMVEFGVSRGKVLVCAAFARNLAAVASVDHAIVRDVRSGKVSCSMRTMSLAAEAVETGLDPRTVIERSAEMFNPGPVTDFKPRSKKNMTEGTIRLLKGVQPLMGDGLAYSAWAYWSDEEKRNVLKEVSETLKCLQKYKRELTANIEGR